MCEGGVGQPPTSISPQLRRRLRTCSYHWRIERLSGEGTSSNCSGKTSAPRPTEIGSAAGKGESLA